MRVILRKSALVYVGLFAVTLAVRAESGFIQHNLVSDLQGMADRTDTNLKNAWGIDHSPTGPWWVNSNGKDKSIVYDSNGMPAPAASPIVVNVSGAPTGIVFNRTMDFQLAPTFPALFLFAGEGGSILGWNPNVNANAVAKFSPTPAPVYKGITLGMMAGHNVIYVANFSGGTVDVVDTNFQKVTLSSTAFRDPTIPAGFAPFNVQNIGGNIVVTYAKQDEDKEDDVAGPGNGYVTIFTGDGALVRRLEHGKWMNSPWGVALAPSKFGNAGGRLLVGQFGSGEIATFEMSSGEFSGLMRGTHGKPITIEGLWGIGFGNNGTAGSSDVLFFAAGIQDEAHGLFGTLTPAKDKDKEGDDEDEKEHKH